MVYLVVAYGLVWLGLVAYLVFLHTQMAGLRQELEALAAGREEGATQ